MGTLYSHSESYVLVSPLYTTMQLILSLEGDRCNAWAKGQQALSRVQGLAWLESLVFLLPRPRYIVEI